MKKNQTIVLIAVIVLIIAGIIGWAVFQKRKVSPEKEVIPGKEETTEELLEKLTPKAVGSLTEEEKKEQKKLLEELTPSKQKPMTEEEKKELEELLKQLTP